MVSTTGEQFAYYELDDDLKPVEKPFPERLQKSVGLIEDNCEPALCTVLFIGGAGGSLRAGVTENPVNLTRSVQGLKTYVTVGGAPVYVWPGGGITLMVDVTRVPEGAFGYVPTPALVAPIEFTLAPRRLCQAGRLRGRDPQRRRHRRQGRRIPQSAPRHRCCGPAIHGRRWRSCAVPRSNGAGLMQGPQVNWLQDGKRLHLNHGPIDLIVEAFGEADECRAAYDQAIARFQTILIELVEELPELRLPGILPGATHLRRPDGAPHGSSRHAAGGMLHHADGRRCRIGSRRNARAHCLPAAGSTAPMSTMAATAPSISARASR